MATEWRRLQIRDLIERHLLAIGDGYRAKNDELGPTGLPFCRAGNVNEGFNFTDADRFPFEGLARVGEKVSEPGDVVFTSKGTVGRFAFVGDQTERFVYSPQLCYWRSLDPEVIDPRYLYYWMTGPDFRSQFGAVAGSTDMAEYVSLSDQRRMWLRIPDIHTQRAIAHILGTLDDKIELNRRMSETLEAIARALFKSWFVDFDPVRAKSEGRDPGLPQPLADLFPDSFEDSQLGHVPQGWSTQRLGDLLDLDKGLSYKGQFLGETGMPMVNLGCFLGHGRFAELAMKRYSGEFKDRHVVRPRDLVLANTDLTQKREVIGSPALIPAREGLDKLLFTHHVFAARFRAGKEPWKLFVYLSLLQEEFRERASGFATGTTVLALPRDAVLDLQFAAPPLALIGAFDSIVVPLIERQWRAAGESHTVTVLRDTLLPNLISGELHVCAAERGEDSRDEV